MSANQDRLCDCQRRSFIRRATFALARNKILQNVLHSKSFAIIISISADCWCWNGIFSRTRIQRCALFDREHFRLKCSIPNRTPHNELFTSLNWSTCRFDTRHANILQQCRKLSYSFAKQWFLNAGWAFFPIEFTLNSLAERVCVCANGNRQTAENGLLQCIRCLLLCTFFPVLAFYRCMCARAMVTTKQKWFVRLFACLIIPSMCSFDICFRLTFDCEPRRLTGVRVFNNSYVTTKINQILYLTA